jgi:hypothetical protein
VIKRNGLFFEHITFSADEISTDEHLAGKAVFARRSVNVQNGRTEFKSKLNMYKGDSSCNISYAILSKVSITRECLKVY